MKTRHCEYCGEDLGEAVEGYGDPVTCGAAECDREARADLASAREERRLCAEEDGYYRYGGLL